MIVVIDYNVGNVRSVCNAFQYLGYEVKLSSDPADIKNSTGLVLPGVAAFGYAVNALGGLADVVKDTVALGRPILGICVGYQMLFDRSCEMGEHEGLGLISGDVVGIPKKPSLSIPHMGWNRVEWPGDMELFAGFDEGKHFYFAHSYYADIKNDSVKTAFTEYGFEMPAAVQKDNVFGVQFHPEKSGPNGLAVLKNFLKICADNAD